MQSIAETCVRFDAAHLSINLVSEIAVPMFTTLKLKARYLSLDIVQRIASLVPRPSASRAHIAYVTFGPLSDKLSDKGSKVTYAMRVRLADGLGTRLAYCF